MEDASSPFALGIDETLFPSSSLQKPKSIAHFERYVSGIFNKK
jgi:hypothetical protein